MLKFPLNFALSHGEGGILHKYAKKKGELMRKSRILLRFSALLLFLATLLPTAISASAASATGEILTARAEANADTAVMRARKVNTYSLKSVSDRNVYSYPTVSVTLGSRSLGNIGKVINGEVYVPIRRFVGLAVSGATVNYDSSTRTVTVVGGGHNISVSDGAYALYASGRCGLPQDSGHRRGLCTRSTQHQDL